MKHDQFTEPLQSDWQAGDVALCILGGRLTNLVRVLDAYPEAGSFYTVEKVGVHGLDFVEKPALWFKDAPVNNCGQRIWAQRRFIKVTPPADMKLEEEEREKEIAK